MNTIKLEQYKKIGFTTKVSAIEFIRANNLRMKPKEKENNFLKRVKEVRIEKKKENVQIRKQREAAIRANPPPPRPRGRRPKTAEEKLPVYGPKNKPRGRAKKIFKKTATITPIIQGKVSQKYYGERLKSRATKSKNIYNSNKMMDKIIEIEEIDLDPSTIPIIARTVMYYHNKNLEELGIKEENEEEDENLFGDIMGFYSLHMTDYILEGANKRLEKINTVKNNKVISWCGIRGNIKMRDLGNIDVTRTIAAIQNNMFNEEDIIVELDKFYNKETQSSKSATVISLQYIYRKNETEGGCTKNKYTTDHKRIGNCNVSIYQNKSDYNNCLFSSLLRYVYDVKQTKGFNGESIRKDLNIPHNTLIPYTMIKRIVEYLNAKTNKNIDYVVVNNEFKIIDMNIKQKDINIGDEYENLRKAPLNTAIIYLNDDHYYIMKINSIVKCKYCYKEYNEAENHKCNPSIESYVFNKLKLQLREEFPFKVIKNKDGTRNYEIEVDKLNEEQKEIYKNTVDENKIVIPYKSKLKYVEVLPGDNTQYTDEEIKNLRPYNILHFDMEALRYAKIYEDSIKKIRNSKFIKNENFKDRIIEFQHKYIKEVNKTTFTQKAYAIGFKFNKFKEYNCSFYDEKTNPEPLKKFIDYLIKLSEKKGDTQIYLNAYNGSGYDYYLLLNELIKRTDVKNIIQNNGRILSMEFGKIKTIDLYQFVQTGLKKACDNFKISKENEKGELDHLKYKSFCDIEKDKDMIYEYLRRDVMGMEELYNKVSEILKCETGINIVECLTLPGYAYRKWSSNLKETIEIPSHKKAQKYIFPATYGGRTYPNQRFYESIHYKELLELEEKIKEYNNNDKEYERKMLYNKIKDISDDYIINLDVTSLYPASMAGFGKFKALYPIGHSREILNNSVECKEAFEKGLLGFYYIKYICPKHIVIPVLPRQKCINGKKCGVIWDLKNNSGCYTSVDIENALSCDYKIEFLGDALVYDQKGDIFGNYINQFVNLKMRADKEDNKSLRTIAKLMLNALYGKTLQKPITSTSKMIKNVLEYDEFIKNYQLKSFEYVNDGCYIATGELIEKEESMTKPCQLGAFVTSYSRRIMLNYMKVMDPTLSIITYTYGDTDSLHAKAKYAKKLYDAGYAVKKEDSSLGIMCSDIDNEGIILKEINLCPKNYLYESLDNLGKFDDTEKCKGIPKDCLRKSLYYSVEKDNTFNEKIEMPNRLKKYNISIPKQLKTHGVEHYSIISVDMKRKFNKTKWEGFNLVDGCYYYPHGHRIETNKEIDENEILPEYKLLFGETNEPEEIKEKVKPKRIKKEPKPKTDNEKTDGPQKGRPVGSKRKNVL